MNELAPLGVYIHWPYCARICPYCDFNVYRAKGREAQAAQLTDAIVADLQAQAEITGPRRLVSIFFGGGTPSLMQPEWVARIIATVRALWTAEDDLEVSLEANPTDAEAGRFAALAQAGVNRLSLGLQSLDDAALRFLGRDHFADEGLRAAAVAAREFPRLSLDAIYARPGQSEADWREELTRIAGLGAEHLSPYQLTLEPGTAFDRAVQRGLWVPPAEDAATALYEATQDVLTAAGYEAYEVSNHARSEGARGRHNLVYWRGWDYVGVGPGAHGRITESVARLATEAAAKPADYIAAVSRIGVGFSAPEALTTVQVAEERLLSGLRIVEGVAFSEVAALGLRSDSPVVQRMIGHGLLADDAVRLQATTAGRRVLDRLSAELALARA